MPKKSNNAQNWLSLINIDNVYSSDKQRQALSLFAMIAIAIIVLGPKDFPIMLKKVGSWIGTAKKYINNIQNEVSNIDLEDKNIQKKDNKENNKDA